MTKKQFWQGASNWGFLGGVALFGVNLISWGLKLETTAGWAYELLIFIVLCWLIVSTGRRNARLSSAAEGYPYARAFGFVLAMMLFAGVVFGVSRFLMYNFIAPEYYTSIFETSLGDMPDQIRSMAFGMLRNPFFWIFQGVIELIFRGGFLGLILCTFVTKKPDIFAGGDA